MSKHILFLSLMAFTGMQIVGMNPPVMPPLEAGAELTASQRQKIAMVRRALAYEEKINPKLKLRASDEECEKVYDKVFRSSQITFKAGSSPTSPSALD